jgi:hypothetical protein
MEKRKAKTRAQQRAAGTKKTALFDIVNKNKCGNALGPRRARASPCAFCSPDGAISAFTRVFDALWRNPGFISRGMTAPHSAALHAGYGLPVDR